MFRRIAELFYPKELKDVIADLRAKDDLNEGALKAFNQSIYFPLIIPIMFLNISIQIYEIYQSGNLSSVFIIVTLIVILALFNLVHSNWNSHYAAYIYGTKRLGTIKKIRALGIGSFVFILEDDETRQEIKVSAPWPVFSLAKTPEVGEKIPFYIAQNTRYTPVSGTKESMKIACLKKINIRTILMHNIHELQHRN